MMLMQCQWTLLNNSMHDGRENKDILDCAICGTGLGNGGLEPFGLTFFEDGFVEG